MIIPGGILMDSTVLGCRTSSSEHRSNEAWLLHNRKKGLPNHGDLWLGKGSLKIPSLSWKGRLMGPALNSQDRVFWDQTWVPKPSLARPLWLFTFPDTSEKFKRKVPKGCYYWASSNIYQHNWLLMQLALMGSTESCNSGPWFHECGRKIWYGSCQGWEKLRKSWNTSTISVFPKKWLFIFILCAWVLCLRGCMYTICLPGAFRAQRRVADPWT